MILLRRSSSSSSKQRRDVKREREIKKNEVSVSVVFPLFVFLFFLSKHTKRLFSRCFLFFEERENFC